MERSFRFIVSGLLLIFFLSCNSNAKKESLEMAISDTEAVGPYLTNDHLGNAVLCWSAKNVSDSSYNLQYSVYDPEVQRFGEIVDVPVSKGCSTSPESMGKVAFKKDGTVIAVFAKRFEGQKNPYAGAIYYSSSRDKGKTWSEAKYLHSDTAHTYGRSFFDIATLKNGELAAVWLDGRYGKKQKGSALFMAQTSKGDGFGRDSLLNMSTCECCRTDIFCDKNGKIHIAYRSILYPKELLGKQVRDIVYISSDDNGRNFSKEQLISKDNWEIEGCPHSGPTLSGSPVNAVWFSAAAGNAGLYHSYALNNGFSKRSLLSATGLNPQSVSLPNDKLAVVFSEPIQEEKMQHSQHDSSGMSHHQPTVSNSSISLKILDRSSEPQSIMITDGKSKDHHPVIISIGKSALVSWIRDENEKSRVFYKAVDFE